MESLLSLAFSNIASRETLRIRKGLRQIEGLLAQICLSLPSPPSTARGTDAAAASKRFSAIVQAPAQAQAMRARSLIELGDDPAFVEFWRLQDGFEWNATTHLINCLERLLSMPPNVSNDNLLTNALYLLQGMLHLHPPSTAIFNSELHMILLLDLLSPSLPATLQQLTLSTLLLVILHNPRNARVFEKVNGLFAVSALLKGHSAADGVRVGVLEVLYAYLMPDQLPHEDDSLLSDDNESVQEDETEGYETDTMRRIPQPAGRAQGYFSDTASDASTSPLIVVADEKGDPDEAPVLKTDEEKERMLSCHLGNVRYLYEAFALNGIFAGC